MSRRFSKATSSSVLSKIDVEDRIILNTPLKFQTAKAPNHRDSLLSNHVPNSP